MRLLDTNVCIGFLRGDAALAPRFAQFAPTELKLCSVVKAELYFGARNSASPASNLRKVEAFCHPFASLPFDDDCAQAYGLLRAELQRTGMTIGANDLMIAATAVANDLTLVTHNTKEFERVVGLELEDWEEAP